MRAIRERVNLRVFRVVALPPPSEREKTQFFAQRYAQQLYKKVTSLIASRTPKCNDGHPRNPKLPEVRNLFLPDPGPAHSSSCQE